MGRTAPRGTPVLRNLATLLSRSRRAAGHPAAGHRATAHQSGPPTLLQLELPPRLDPTLGCDAVGFPARYGARMLARLPRAGCVFAEGHWWWWIVPAGSDLEVVWPLPAHYAPGARVPVTRPRLIHRPDETHDGAHGVATPYTPPIPLYVLACQLTGATPLWTAGAGSGR
ncbi:hypothetical protein QCN29_29320 [Streptomyces sp. HNM0663]|uniref:Uncharacterized protein n=1 Tax=Streptomyces chengmaiensis TaxID=3040919 RepID=A0ABT6HYA6_9ACTN|nr:hypothetical protein [Streptomyces chengmaiensis]MDH2392809.1 hypothetical protein [Streptomyces chengmaiensis]